MKMEEVIGILAGIFTTMAVLPQIVKAVKTRNVEDVSKRMFVILCLGVGLWMVYGIMKTDWPIIITNGVSFLLNGIMLYVVLTSSDKNKDD